MGSGASSQPKDRDLTYIARSLQATQTGVLKKTDYDTWALDAVLYSIGAVGTPGDGTFLVGNGSSWVGESGATARTSIGASTVGSNLLTLTNPSAVTFPRINADNTVSAIDAATLSAALGTGSGLSAQVLHGFPNRTATSRTFNNSSRVFTLGVATTATVYIAGVPYTLSNPGLTVDLDDKTLSVGLWFIWAEVVTGAVVLNAAKTSWDILDTTKIPVALVYWNGSAGALQEERHSAYADQSWHQWAHDTIGARIENDGSFAQTYPTTSVDGKIELVGGSLWDEDLETVVSAAKGKLARNWYETASGVWTFADGTNNAGNDRPYIWNSGTSRLQYPKSNSSYALTDANSNDYIAVWVFASNDVDRPIYTVTQAKTAPYNTLALARNATMPTLAFGPEMRLLYRWIYRGDGEYQEAVDYRTSSSLPGGGVTAPSASSVTAVATAPLTAGSVQGQLDEIAAIVGGRTIPFFLSDETASNISMRSSTIPFFLSDGTASSIPAGL